MARLVLGRSEEVAEVVEDQLVRARAEGEPHGVGKWLEVLSHLRWLQGRAAASSACARELLRLCGRGTSQEVVARLLLGRSLGQSGDLHSWQRHALRAVEVAVALEDRWLEGQACLAVGVSLAPREHEAVPWLERATAAFEGSVYWSARCEVPLPMALAEPPHAAELRFARLAQIFASHGDRPTQAICLVGRARQLRLLGRLDEAVACSEEAEGVGYRSQQVLARYGQARVYALRRDYLRADALYRELLDDPELPAATRSMMLVPGMGAAARRSDVEAFSRGLLVAAPHAAALSEDLWGALEECEETDLPRVELLQLAALAYDGSSVEVRADKDATLSRLSHGDLPIGPLLLTEPVGEGGMATVWRALDRRRPDEVFAVKVLRVPDGVSGPALMERFRRELRALATLDHPHVQPVLDHGVTGAALALLSDGRIPEGSPGLIMPLASGGTLRRWCGRMPWHDVRVVLEQLLDGLAAAHARGVLHLDLKPENVLMASAQAPFHARLADFGLARAIGEERIDQLVGTPAYMAPEQFRGDVRCWGPPTDLYALGCLAWALVCGRSPFQGSPAALRSQHLSAPRPPLTPAIDVPSELEEWLLRLLRRAPEERFDDAVAAARGLEALGSAVAPAAAPGPAVVAGVDDTFAFDLDDPTGEVPRPLGVTATREPVDVPARWAAPSPPPAYSAAMVGLRPVPLVGRGPEQEVLWQALRDASSGSPRAVALLGEPGMGGGSLTTWLAHQVRLLGLGTVLTARMVAAPTRGLGLHGLVQDALRTRGLDGDELAAWLHRCPWRPSSVTVEQCLAALEADELPERLVPLLAGLAGQRPVLVCLEGVHHQAHIDAVVASVMRSSWPVLVVLTADHRVEAHRRGRWREAGVSECVLRRLDPQSARALADAVLPLNRAQQEQLLATCGGHPGRIVRTLKRMVAQGLTTPDGDERFRVPELALLDMEDGADGSLPRMSAGAASVVYALAVLGGEAPREEVEALLRQHGAAWRAYEEVVVEDGIARIPAWLATAATRHLDELGELPVWHRDAAQSLHGDGGWVTLRRGRHHVLAGEADKGATALRQACDRLEGSVAATVFPEWESALHAAGVPRGADRWLDGWTAWLTGRIGSGYRGADDTLRDRAMQVVAQGDPTQRAAARLALATMEHGADLDRSRSLYAEVVADDAVAEPVRAVAGLNLVYIQLHHGQVEEALAGALSAAAGLPVGHALHAHALQMVGKIYQQQGRLDEAEHWTRACLDLGQDRGGSGRSQIHGWAVLGDLMRERGDLDEAERCYREALALSQAFVDDHRFVDELNLVMLDARRRRLGNHAERLPVLERKIGQIGGPFVVFTQLLALGLPARRGQGAVVVQGIEEALAPTGWCDAELAATAELVGELLAEQHRYDERVAVLNLAAAQWEAVGRPEDAQRVRASADRGGAGPAS